ncbi:hypothetical protein TRFO_15167 [Tritrichomonas foetus]|uniref:Uncharacterized protein n=1 Tax=Tritrichomonas foetus TaxID=1144522 RepID=A0A1J4KTP1_9EUKA|nr:hypothetical protein TRFO_15167 [Tritrichomonas foetus]|eukprot:OHT14498.1 hypothetical protein TRFO_15167 [Tritrichomonas foetus]
MKNLVKDIFTNDAEAVKKYLHSEIPKDAKFSLSDENNELIKMLLPINNLTLLHIAAAGDSLEVFIILEQYGFDIGCSSADSYLPIHYACMYSAFEVVSYILSKRPEMAKSEPPVEYHLLYLTATSGDPDIMTLLFDNNVNIKSQANSRNNPFFKAAQNRNIECLKVLLKNGERPPNNDDFTFPMHAAINLQPEAVEFLIEYDESLINFCSPVTHRTLLGLCCFNGDSFKKVILNILRKAQEMEIEPPSNFECQGPIHWMCIFLDLDVAHAFLQHKINVNRIDNEGKTGFHYLIDKPAHMENTIIELMKLLISYGFNVNIQRKSQQNASISSTVLEHFVTAISKSYKIIEFLIYNNADIYALNKHNKRLIDIVMSKNDEKMKKIFKKSPSYKPEPIEFFKFGCIADVYLP